MNLTALSARFSSIARRRSASPATSAGRSAAIAISVLMPLLPARARNASATASARRRGENGSCCNVEPGGVGLDRIDDQRGERGQVVGAALDGGGPAALARAEIGDRQKLGQRNDPGQRRADVVHDAGERGFHRAPLRARAARLCSEAAGAAVCVSYASPSPTPGRPCHGSRAQSSPTSLRISAAVAPCARSSRKPVASVDFDSLWPSASRIRRWWW